MPESESLRCRTSCQCVVGVMRSLEVICAARPFGISRRSVEGTSEVSLFDVDSKAGAVFFDVGGTEDSLSA